MTRRAVVLLSGGIDSTTTLAIARAEGYDVYALSVRYGQRHEIELERARAIADAFGVARHLMITIDLREIGGSALTDERIAVPKDRTPEEIGAEIPITYVPGRNTIFLAFALAWAEVLGAEDIFFGANVLDYSGYPDCRPEYLRAFEHMANLATRAGVSGQARFRLHAPLLLMTKAEIIRRGRELGVDYRLTWSCYDPVEREGEVLACGRCDSCQIRRRGFAEAGIEDPIPYAN
ncbi:7-cyano-7-deazaguanine synthase [bacterium HR08]|nr:7-cyano-7-deazaguanine synthase [bacterium HR08]